MTCYLCHVSILTKLCWKFGEILAKARKLYEFADIPESHAKSKLFFVNTMHELKA